MGEELCNVGKVLDEKCDLLVYCRKVVRQQIGSLFQEDRDLLTLQTKCTFDALSDIVFTMKRNMSVDIKQLKDIV